MMPNAPGREAAPGAGGEPGPTPVMFHPPGYRWYHKIWAVVLITFCLEIGCFLTIFPWTTYWEINYFSQIVPAWHVVWYNAYVRGAVSGLGVLNLYIGLLEVFRLRRFSRR